MKKFSMVMVLGLFMVLSTYADDWQIDYDRAFADLNKNYDFIQTNIVDGIGFEEAEPVIIYYLNQGVAVHIHYFQKCPTVEIYRKPGSSFEVPIDYDPLYFIARCIPVKPGIEMVKANGDR